ncbi:hypothetical protein HV153_04555 [Escherichia coli]|uniref:hypothetical protein n=1 Tax=Escherichia coli TaxID=562 RepID=UPI0002A457D6|nr:hypothetical protein [Escherichia coli]EEW0002018.1 hypothetical protein [Escherichia coli]EJE8078595.1 hypothetical protein [Escherichia coli]ELI77869.1 hypothetical protein WK1_02889 [Escherichia coli KTE138]QLX53220.1 hypothetical protein HV153_04555 [Escherichia coli]HAI5931737.1 hypothetical protein [Escherichia coli]
MMNLSEDYELMKTRLLLIRYYTAYVDTRIATGEFGDILSEDREERWEAGRARANLLVRHVDEVMGMGLGWLYETLEGVWRDGERYGLSTYETEEAFELWKLLRDKLPEGYVPEYLK